MVNVLLSSDSVDVVGGKTRVDVNVSLGEKGDRGSYIFVGPGNPNVIGSSAIAETPQPYDMFINLLPADPEYLNLYQYINVDGDFSWARIMRLIPNTYVKNFDVEFVDGQVTIPIEVKDVISISSIGVYTSNNFNFQYTIESSIPTASSIVVGQIGLYDNAFLLPVTIHAVELSGSTWQPISGDRKIDMLVAVA